MCAYSLCPFVDEFLSVVHELSDQSNFMATLTSVTKQLNEKTRELLNENYELGEQLVQCQNELNDALERQEVSTSRTRLN